ncbi:MAG TPA: hypothetical protein DHV28_05690 [Ignavibacteriales bacterium]|nr:hypothetical protein [Ignavibacteriales bacterium]
MKSLRFLFFLLFVTAIQFYTDSLFAQQQQDTIKGKPVQYRRGIELQQGYQTYDEKYSGKNLNEEKRRLFPLQSTGIWTELNPKVPRVDYIGIDFINPDIGWACGDLGAIIKTTNGGNSWTVCETSTTTLLLKVHSYNGEIVIASGYDGLILRSSDGGETFEQIPSGVGSGIDLWGVQMLNNMLGWICGMNNTLLKTTDAGLSWQAVNAGLNAHYWSLDFLNENYGMIACGGGIVLKTTDGGNGWTQTQAGDTRDLYTIDVIDSLHIAAAGGSFGKNVYSSDGGTIWTENTNLPYSAGANWIYFLNTDTGYVTGDGLYLRKTTNRGQSWFSTPYFEIGRWQFEILNGNTGYGVGDNLTITKTEDDFTTGRQLILNVNFADVFFIDEMKGFAIGNDVVNGGLYKTEDGGISFQKVEDAPYGKDLLFLDSLVGFIAGSYKTTNGGESWYQVNTGGGTKVFFINDSVGWSIDSHIYKSTNQGESWFTQLTLLSDNFSSIFFIDSLNGWATSRYVWQTTNGGENWVERTDIPIFFPDEIYFVDSTGFIIQFLELYRTTDSGSNWFNQLSSQYIMRSFGWLNTQHGFIIGDGVYETIDNGGTWQEILELRNVGIRKVQAPLPYLGYSTGNKGLIYKYLDTSYVPIELISFEGESQNDQVVLKWMTASELNNLGFYVKKSLDKKNWKTIAFVEGKGTTTDINMYEFIDKNVINNKIYYQLQQLDYDGTFTYSNIVEVTVAINDFTLSQNFPNPANPSTCIAFSIPFRTNVKINLFSIVGEFVMEILNEEIDKGRYNININLSNLAAGVYIYRMTTNKGYSNVKKLILLK